MWIGLHLLSIYINGEVHTNSNGLCAWCHGLISLIVQVSLGASLGASLGVSLGVSLPEELDFSEAFGRVLAAVSQDSDCDGQHQEFWGDVTLSQVEISEI